MVPAACGNGPRVLLLDASRGQAVTPEAHDICRESEGEERAGILGEGISW